MGNRKIPTHVVSDFILSMLPLITLWCQWRRIVNLSLLGNFTFLKHFQPCIKLHYSYLYYTSSAKLSLFNTYTGKKLYESHWTNFVCKNFVSYLKMFSINWNCFVSSLKKTFQLSEIWHRDLRFLFHPFPKGNPINFRDKSWNLHTTTQCFLYPRLSNSS